MKLVKKDITERLNDLFIQATQENSHFYVAATAKECIEYIEKMRKEFNYAHNGLLLYGLNISQILFLKKYYEINSGKRSDQI